MGQRRPTVSTGGGNYVGTVRGRARVGELVAGDKVAGNKYTHDTHFHAPHYTLGVTGRVVLISGLLIGFAGFAAFGYPVVKFLLVIFGAMQNNSEPDLSTVAFVPFLPLGFVMAFVGTVMIFLGAAFVRRAR